MERSYLFHVPASYTGAEAVPLLIDAHGSGETDTDQRGRSGQLAQSDARGFNRPISWRFAGWALACR